MFPLWIIPVVIVIMYLFSSVKILREYERGVIFRLGRVLPQPKGPGIFLVFAPIDRMVRTSLRIEAMEVPAQDVITRDNVTVKVNAVVYFRVIDPTKAVIEVANYLYATSQLSQTSLRSVLGEVELDALLSQREKLNVRLQSVLDQNTGPWGIKVTMVEVKQVDLPEQMIRAIARQAEAERERRGQDHSRRRRGCRSREFGKSRRDDGAAAGRYPAPLPANAGRNRLGKKHNGSVPAADGPTIISRTSAEETRRPRARRFGLVPG